MRNTPLRAFAKKSPIQGDTTNIVKTLGKKAASKAIKKGATSLAGKAAGALAGGLGAVAGLGGAAYGLFKGYGNLAKTKHGKEIIKGARTMPGKM